MVTTTRATSNVPGATGRRYYGDNAYEHFFVWRGTAARQNMPLIVYIKPGHTFNMGERVMDPHTSASPALGDAIDLIYSTMNWPIVGIEFRPPHSADSPKREPFSFRSWPGQIHSIAKFMRYARQHWNDETLWGTGGSIDPGRIMVIGSSSGHTMGLALAAIPPDAFGSPPLVLGQTEQVGDHRPNVCAGFIGQTDWTQFILDSGATSGPFAYDIMQYFHGLNGTLTNTNLPNAVKRSASPYWWLRYLEPGRTAFWASWGANGSGQGANLTPADFLPDSPRTATNKRFIDPHHFFQAKPLEDALKRRGAINRIIWGDNSNNPLGWNNDNVGLDSTTTSQDLLKFVRNDLGWPVVS